MTSRPNHPRAAPDRECRIALVLSSATTTATSSSRPVPANSVAANSRATPTWSARPGYTRRHRIGSKPHIHSSADHNPLFPFLTWPLPFYGIAARRPQSGRD